MDEMSPVHHYSIHMIAWPGLAHVYLICPPYKSRKDDQSEDVDWLISRPTGVRRFNPTRSLVIISWLTGNFS